MRTAKTKADTPMPAPCSPTLAFRGSDACQGKPISSVEQVFSDTASAFCPWHLAFPSGCCCRHMPSGTRIVTNAPQSLCKEELSWLCGVLVTWVGKTSQRSEYVNFSVTICLNSQMLCVHIVLQSSPHQTAPFFLVDVFRKRP